MTEKPIGIPDKTQFDSARDLYNKMDDWKCKDRILNGLREAEPDFANFRETLQKVLAINEFYNAGGSNLLAMAIFIATRGSEIMELYHQRKSQDTRNAHIEVVRRIALREIKLGNTKKDGCPVFASKFAHFFIDPEAFPILDDKAEKMVLIHLGDCRLYPESQKEEDRIDYTMGKRYEQFYDNLLRLKKMILNSHNSEPCNKELDQYLWLAGNYRMMKLEASGVNKEIKKIYSSDPSTIEGHFKGLFPYNDPQPQNPFLIENLEKKKKRKEEIRNRLQAARGSRKQ